MAFGQKFIEKKVEGDKVIIISEYKDFPIDFDNIANIINDSITDDWECQLNDYGLTMDYNGGWYSLDVDTCLDGLNNYYEYIESFIEENGYCFENEIDEIQDLIDQLTIAKGFTIYFSRGKDYYTNDKPKGD